MSNNDTSACCLYHAIIEAIDAYSEAYSPTNVNDIMDALITVTAELVAMHGDGKVRNEQNADVGISCAFLGL